jgi:hypothetical protein
MSAATAVLGRMRFVRDNVDSASFVVVLPDAACYERMVALQIARVMEAVPPHPYRGVVVELQPRDFRQNAAHFLRVATPTQWPVDEHDVD